jgi:hypothetical protein
VGMHHALRSTGAMREWTWTWTCTGDNGRTVPEGATFFPVPIRSEVFPCAELTNITFRPDSFSAMYGNRKTFMNDYCRKEKQLLRPLLIRKRLKRTVKMKSLQNFFFFENEEKKL